MSVPFDRVGFVDRGWCSRGGAQQFVEGGLPGGGPFEKLFIDVVPRCLPIDIDRPRLSVDTRKLCRRNKRDAHHARAAKLLLELVVEPLAVSPITLTEIFVGPARKGQLEAARLAVAQLDIHPVALPEDASVRLAHFRAQTNLKLPDCCVLLAAEQSAATVATFDEGLIVAARKSGIGVA